MLSSANKTCNRDKQTRPTEGLAYLSAVDMTISIMAVVMTVTARRLNLEPMHVPKETYTNKKRPAKETYKRELLKPSRT